MLRKFYEVIPGGVSEGKQRNLPRSIFGGIVGEIFEWISRGSSAEISKKKTGRCSKETVGEVSEKKTEHILRIYCWSNF